MSKIEMKTEIRKIKLIQNIFEKNIIIVHKTYKYNSI